MDTEKLIEESSPELEAEMRRIRNLFGPPNPHDREDLVSYAKRVLRLVERSRALEASTRRVKELEEALGDLKVWLEVAASVPTINPHTADDVAALGKRIGYGALMGAASALWRDELDDLAGGEFVCGPCRATVESYLRRIRTTLSQEGL